MTALRVLESPDFEPVESAEESSLQIFTSPEFGRIRAIERGGEPWFVAADVCRSLEIDRTQTRRLDDDEKGVCSIPTLGGGQDMSIVNEPGLYSLVLGSRKPEAKAFKRWITHDVIPSIRKHGAYMTPDTLESMINSPEFGIKLLTALKDEQDKRKALEAQAEENAPKVLFADSVSASKDSILIGEMAKLLKQNGVDIGQNRLFRWLRNNGYLMKHGESYNLPTQKAMNKGLFEIKEVVFQHPDGFPRTKRTTMVTGAGQNFFINLFLKKGGEAV